MELNQKEVLESKFFYLTLPEVRQVGGREILSEGYSRSATF